MPSKCYNSVMEPVNRVLRKFEFIRIYVPRGNRLNNLVPKQKYLIKTFQDSNSVKRV